MAKIDIVNLLKSELHFAQINFVKAERCYFVSLITMEYYSGNKEKNVQIRIDHDKKEFIGPPSEIVDKETLEKLTKLIPKLIKYIESKS